MIDPKIAEIAKVMSERKPGPNGSTDGLKEFVTRHFPDATPDQIQQAIRSETRIGGPDT
jgi:hypothetical protein